MARSNRSEEITLFDAFVSALKRLSERDKYLFSLKRRKIPLMHRLAIYLEEELPSHLYCDLMLHIKLEEGESTPDLLVHDRNGTIYLAIYAKESYLNKKDQEEARTFHRDKECLTLAFSFLEDKDYFLIYRFGSTFTDYLHLSREDFSESLLKRCETDSDETFSDTQLLLGIKVRKKRKLSKKTTLPRDL